jgi:RNA polymerase sigma factor (TIGR02999 family)
MESLLPGRAMRMMALAMLHTDHHADLPDRSDAGDRAGSPSAGLFRQVYDELRSLARRRLRRERPDHTLGATALVHEVYLKLADQTRADWQGRTHFLCVAAEAMRRVLIDHARAHRAAKRGGGQDLCSPLEVSPVSGTEHDRDDELWVAEILEAFEREHPRQAEVAKLRFFAGLTVGEIAEAIGVSDRTVKSGLAIRPGVA